MIARKTRYAIMALTFLAREYEKEPIPISRIAKSENIPQRFLEGILLTLKRCGILNSTRGKIGGYYLIKAPQNITLLDVVMYMEGCVASFDCILNASEDECEFCKNLSICNIRDVFMQIHNRTIETLRSTTLHDLTITKERKVLTK